MSVEEAAVLVHGSSLVISLNGQVTQAVDNQGMCPLEHEGPKNEQNELVQELCDSFERVGVGIRRIQGGYDPNTNLGVLLIEKTSAGLPVSGEEVEVDIKLSWKVDYNHLIIIADISTENNF